MQRFFIWTTEDNQTARVHRLFIGRTWFAGIFSHLATQIRFIHYNRSLFACVDVLRPSQPNGVMSSAVSLPNHTFTEQA